MVTALLFNTGAQRNALNIGLDRQVEQLDRQTVMIAIWIDPQNHSNLKTGIFIKNMWKPWFNNQPVRPGRVSSNLVDSLEQ